MTSSMAWAEIFHGADAGKSLVDGHRADGDGGSADDRFADAWDIAAGGEIHHGVGAVLDGGFELFEFAGDITRNRGVADIRIDLALGGNADAHRLQIGVMDIGGE